MTAHPAPLVSPPNRGGAGPGLAAQAAASALVLAGGRSSRFGVDKLEVYVGGRPLLWHAVTAVASVCREVVVIAGPEDDVTGPPAGIATAKPAALHGVRLRLVHDEEPFGGPLLGVLAGLRVARQSLCLVVGGDMPLLRPQVLAHMLAVARADRAVPPCSVALRLDGLVQPLPLVLRRDAATRVAALAARGRRALRELIAAIPLRVLEQDEWLPYDPAGLSFVDIDRMDDLVRWSARLTATR